MVNLKMEFVYLCGTRHLYYRTIYGV